MSSSNEPELSGPFVIPVVAGFPWTNTAYAPAEIHPELPNGLLPPGTIASINCKGTGVLIAHRPYVQILDGDEAEAVLFILKNRDGRLGRIDCRFDVQKLEFLDHAT